MDGTAVSGDFGGDGASKGVVMSDGPVGIPAASEMTRPVDPADIESAVLRARWEALTAEGAQLRAEMATAVSTRDQQAIVELNLRVQAHRSRLHDFEIATTAFRNRFGRELKL